MRHFLWRARPDSVWPWAQANRAVTSAKLAVSLAPVQITGDACKKKAPTPEGLRLLSWRGIESDFRTVLT